MNCLLKSNLSECCAVTGELYPSVLLTRAKNSAICIHLDFIDFKLNLHIYYIYIVARG